MQISSQSPCFGIKWNYFCPRICVTHIEVDELSAWRGIQEGTGDRGFV